jgi:hypothetical protein
VDVDGDVGGAGMGCGGYACEWYGSTCRGVGDPAGTGTGTGAVKTGAVAVGVGCVVVAVTRTIP